MNTEIPSKGPFHYDGWAAPEQTVARPEIAELRALVADNARVYASGRRRVGKTTGVINTVEGMNRPILRIDLDGVASTLKLQERIRVGVKRFLPQFPAILKEYESETRKGGEISGRVPGGILGVSLHGERKVSERSMGESLDDLLNSVSDIAKRTNAVVFVDEFQAVKNRGIEDPSQVLGSFSSVSDPATTRGKVCWIFAGSNRHAMHEIFNGDKSMFYQRTQNLTFDSIDEKVIVPFLNDRFGGNVPDEIGHEAYKWTEGIPGDLQRVYSALKSVHAGDDTVTDDDLVAAKAKVLADIGRTYALTVTSLTSEQARMIDMIADEDIRSVDSLSERVIAGGIPNGEESLRGLLELGLVHIPNRPDRGLGQVIERPEPLLFHYLLQYPAIEHRRPSNYLTTRRPAPSHEVAEMSGPGDL